MDHTFQEISAIFYRRIQFKINTLNRRILDAIDIGDYNRASILQQTVKGLKHSVKIFKASKQELDGKGGQ